jgi:hypothetical protein
VASPESVRAAASLVGKLGAYSKWAQCEDRTAATAPARAALQQKFLDQAGGDPVRAESFRKAHYTRMALRSAQSRRRNREAREAAAEKAS